jgi:hypothetical protein
MRIDPEVGEERIRIQKSCPAEAVASQSRKYAGAGHFFKEPISGMKVAMHLDESH